MSAAPDLNKILGQAVKKVAEIEKNLKVPTKGGKKYVMVVDRVRIFRNHFGLDARIITEQTYDGVYVRSVTNIWVNDNLVANGIAEENRNYNIINKTSAAENAETSSIGRALANLGLQGGEYPSGDEMLKALAQQEQEREKSLNDLSDHVDVDNKVNSGSQLDQIDSPGFSKKSLAEQVKIFSSKLEVTTSPGEVNKVATKFKPWIESLKDSDKKEVISMYKQQLKVTTNA
tara:strand:+ start:478 stop:1170 length:693 start_codon:yes stop_codon:yes gene_type:complete